MEAQHKISKDLSSGTTKIESNFMEIIIDVSEYATCSEGFCDFYKAKLVVNNFGDNIPGSIKKNSEGIYVVESLL